MFEQNESATRTQTCWIEVTGGRLHAKIWTPMTSAEDKTPIVLFHDSLGCVTLWRDFPAELSTRTGRRVIAYDRLGFGQSSVYPDRWHAGFIQDEAARFFPQVREQLGISHFIALGYSVGGIMAACCAAMFPVECEALITQSAPACVDERMIEGLLAAKQAFSEPGQIERLAKYHGEKAAWVLSAWIDMWLSPAFTGWRIEQVATGISCPLLVIHGDQDEYGSLEHPQRLAALTTGKSELLILENCRHMPHREHPETVLEAIARFLAPNM